jgi:hypothetical protein
MGDQVWIPQLRHACGAPGDVVSNLHRRRLGQMLRRTRLGSADTDRVARRLRSKNLGLREEGRSSVRKMRLRGRNPGSSSSDGQERVVGTPRSRRACSGNKFRRGQAGEVYDVAEIEPNRKSRSGLEVQRCGTCTTGGSSDPTY